MASYPLVGIQDDLGPLVRLSLLHHHVPVTAIFDVFEELTRERFLAVATPLLDEKGAREAYFKVFTALKNETFSTQTFLRLHTLVISTEQVQEIRRALRRGAVEANLPKLAHLGEVVVRTTEDPKKVTKSGMLHISRQRDGMFQLVFMSMDGSGGSAKPSLSPSLERLRDTLRILKADKPTEIDSLQNSDQVSIFANPTLENLYNEGLI